MCLPFSVALAAKIPIAPDRIASLTVADYEAGLADRSLFELEDRSAVLWGTLLRRRSARLTGNAKATKAT